MFKALYGSGARWLWITAVVIVVDRLSKMWVDVNLVAYESLRVTSFLNLTLAYNQGAAFSFLSGQSGWQNLLLGGIAIIVSLIMLVWLLREDYRNVWVNVALSLIIGGAIGNLWDRYLFSYVIDFLDFHWKHHHFAIFNIADSAICVGSFMLVCYWVFMNKQSTHMPRKRHGVVI